MHAHRRRRRPGRSDIPRRVDSSTLAPYRLHIRTLRHYNLRSYLRHSYTSYRTRVRLYCCYRYIYLWDTRISPPDTTSLSPILGRQNADKWQLRRVNRVNLRTNVRLSLGLECQQFLGRFSVDFTTICRRSLQLYGAVVQILFFRQLSLYIPAACV